MKFDQDLCLNFWYDFKKLLWQDELNPRVRCAFGNVFLIIHFIIFWSSCSNVKIMAFGAIFLSTCLLSGFVLGTNNTVSKSEE